MSKYNKKRKAKGIITGVVSVLATTLLIGGVISLVGQNKDIFNFNSSDETSSTSSENLITNYKFTLVGSMNEWNVKDNTYLLTKEKDDIYSIEFTSIDDNTEFKIINNNSDDVQFTSKNVVVGTDLIDTTKENITLLDACSYYIKLNCKTKEIEIVKLDVSLLNAHFSPITDTWGSDSSVECKEEKVIIGDKYYSSSITLDNQYSSCLLSNFYYSKGQFDIWANFNVIDYGVFAFWLTGVEDDVNNPFQELTFELYKENQIICASSSNNENYTENKLNANFKFNEWHKYSINFENEKAEFKVDDKVIYTITENLPTCDYFRVNIGLLYPKTGWTGNIDRTLYNSCNMMITNFGGTSI